MTKNHVSFKPIKKIITAAVILISLTLTNNSFAISEAQTLPKQIPVSYHIKQIENCSADYQIKRYLESLSDEDLKTLYNKIFQVTLRNPHRVKLLRTRQMISKTQSEREFSRITQRTVTPKLKKDETIPYSKSPESPEYKRQKPIHTTTIPTKIKTVSVQTRVCKCCKKPRPITNKTTTFKCEHCGYESAKYMCEECVEERYAKILIGKLRTHRTCPYCKQHSK